MIPLSKLSLLLLKYKYGMVIIAAGLEGPIVGILCGFFVKLGYFHFWPLYPILICADLFGDAMWYMVGFYGARHAIAKWGHFIGLNPRVMQKIETKFKQHQNKTILINKATAGFGFGIVALVTAGVVRLPIKNYAFMNILGGLSLSATLIFIGYFFGNLYQKIDAGLHAASFALVVAVIIAMVYGFQRFMRKRLS